MKARNGDGSITSRETKTRGTVWDVQLTVKDRRGVSLRRTKRGFKTEALATAWRDAEKRRARLGQTVKAPPLTVPQICKRYIEAQRHLKGSTQAAYWSVLNVHIAPKFNVRVEILDQDRMQKFMYDLQDEAMLKGRSGSGTVKQARRLIMAALNWAARPAVG
ncbi:MAG: hypothetical protein ACK4L7_12475, partial [Flavobacteriales bacterium]